MDQLLLAEATYERQASELESVEGIAWVTLDSSGKLRLDGEAVEADALELSMVRLDMELFQAHPESVPDLIKAAGQLRFVQTAVAGLDSPMLQEIVRNTDVFCNSDAQSPSIAEFVLASVLNRWHRFDLRAGYQRKHEWQDNAFRQILDSHWLIVGFGNIGQRVAMLVKSGGARVTGIRRNLALDEHADRLGNLGDIPDFLPEADVVVLACALNDETRGLADQAFFASMKSDAVLVNIGRGDLVDEPALLDALDQGEFDYAALDVFSTEPLPDDSPIWNHDRIQVTPHASHRGTRTDQRFDELFVANLKRFLAGEEVTNRVSPDSL